MTDQLYIPRKDVDFFTVGRLQTQLQRSGLKREAAKGIAEAVSQHAIDNNRDRWLAIERWANRNVTPAGNASFDCTVDANSATNNLSTLVFQDVASAITNMFALGFTTVLRIGFIPRYNTGTQLGIPAKDQVALSNANVPHTVVITNINGPQVGGANSSIPADQGSGCIWDVNGQAHSCTTQPVEIELHNVTMINNIGGRQNLLGGTYSGRVLAYGCNFEGNGASATVAVSLTTGTVYAADCTFHDVNCTGTVWLENCYIAANVTTTSQQWGGGTGGTWFIAADCMWTPATGVNPFPFILPSPSVLILGGAASLQSWRFSGAGTQRTEFRCTGSSQLIYIEIASGSLGAQPTQWADVNVTGTPDTIRLDGAFGKLTIPAPLATQARVGHVISGTVLTTTDITGPAVLQLGVGHVNVLNGNSLTLRGSGICGVVRVEGSGGAGAIGVNMIGCTDCNIQASGNLAPTVGAGTQKGFAIDATSARNILDFAGASQFPVASTDAGAGDVVRQT